MAQFLELWTYAMCHKPMGMRSPALWEGYRCLVLPSRSRTTNQSLLLRCSLLLPELLNVQSDYPHIIPFKIGAITNYSIINVRIFPFALWLILHSLHTFFQNGFGLITMWKLVESRMLKGAKDIKIYPILYLISQFVAGIKNQSQMELSF